MEDTFKVVWAQASCQRSTDPCWKSENTQVPVSCFSSYGNILSLSKFLYLFFSILFHLCLENTWLQSPQMLNLHSCKGWARSFQFFQILVIIFSQIWRWLLMLGWTHCCNFFTYSSKWRVKKWRQRISIQSMPTKKETASSICSTYQLSWFLW